MSLHRVDRPAAHLQVPDEVGGSHRFTEAPEWERAALTLFATRGFRTVSVDEVGALLGVTGRTIHRVFRSTGGILLAGPRRQIRRAVTACAGLPPTADPFGAAWDALASVERDRDPQFERLWLRAAIEAPEIVQQAWGERVVIAEELRRFFVLALGHDGMEAAALASTVHGAVSSAVAFWQKGDARDDLGDLLTVARSTLRAFTLEGQLQEP